MFKIHSLRNSNWLFEHAIISPNTQIICWHTQLKQEIDRKIADKEREREGFKCDEMHVKSLSIERLKWRLPRISKIEKQRKSVSAIFKVNVKRLSGRMLHMVGGNNNSCWIFQSNYGRMLHMLDESSRWFSTPITCSMKSFRWIFQSDRLLEQLDRCDCN